MPWVYGKSLFDKTGKHYSMIKSVMTEFNKQELLYVLPTNPTKYSDWPTLGNILDSGKLVAVFLDIRTNMTAVDLILSEFEIRIAI